jgi:hypothetical protein
MNRDELRDKIHELKTHPPYFAAVKSGEKNFEIRVNDRDFKVGDTLLLCEYEPDAKRYTGNTIERKVTYIAQGVFGLPENVCVMSLCTAADLKAALAGDGIKFTSAELAALLVATEQTFKASGDLAGFIQHVRDTARDNYPNNIGKCPLCGFSVSGVTDGENLIAECNDCTFDAYAEDYYKFAAAETSRLTEAEKYKIASRYALATFRALDRYTFEDSEHGLLIAEAVEKLEELQDAPAPYGGNKQ